MNQLTNPELLVKAMAILQNLRRRQPGLLILILLALSFGSGAKANLCLKPGGAVHLEASYTACALAAGHADQPDSLAQSDSQLAEQDRHCLDLSVGGDASDRHHSQKITPPPPALVALTSTIQLAHHQPLIFPVTSPRPPRHLQTLHSVILLI